LAIDQEEILRTFFSNLRFRLILLVLLAILPALGLILRINLEQRRYAVADVQQETLRLVRLAGVEQEYLIDSAHQLLLALAQLPPVQTGDQASCQTLLANLLSQYPFYTGFTAATPSGDVFCSAPPLTEPVNFSDRAWYQQLIQTSDFVVGKYQIGRISGEPVLVLAHPLLDTTGRLQAIVTTGLDLDWLAQLAAEAQLPPGSVVNVVDRNGTILARYPDPGAWVGQSMPEAVIIRAVLAQDEGVTEAPGLDGVTRLYAFASLSGKSDVGLGVHMALGIPLEVVFADINRALARNLMLLGVVSGLALVVAWAAGDLFIVRQTKALLRATQRLAAGDLDASTDTPYRRGELGQLAQAFDRMAGTLRRREAERDRAERELRRVNRALATLSECNQAVARATQESQLLQEICRIIVEVGGYRLAWVGFAEQGETKTVRPVAQAGYEEGYLETINITWADTDEGRGPTGTAIRTGEPVVASDILTNPDFAPWRDQAVKRGYSSSVALPLFGDARPFGALNIYAGEPDAFDVEELELLADLAGNLAYGIRGLRTHAARERAEETLRESEERYRLLFSKMLDGFALHEIICDEAGKPSDYRFLEVNPAFERLTGLHAKDILGRTVLEVLPGTEPSWIDIYGRVALTGEAVHFQDYSGELGKHYEVTAFSPKRGQFAVIFVDITARKRMEEEIRHRNRELELLNQVIAASATEQSPEVMLETACRELAQAFDLPQAAAALLNEKKTEAVVVAEYRAKGRPSGLDATIPVQGNPSFQYLLTGKAPLVVEDAQADPRLASIHELMRQLGTVSLLILPLTIKGEVVGSLGLEAAEPRHFSAEEISLAWSVAEQVAGGLTRARLAQTQRRLITAIEQTAEGVLITDIQGTILYVNPTFERVTGYSRAEAVGQNPRILKSGKHDTAFYEELWATISAGEVWHGRLVNKKKDGTLYTEEVTISPVQDEYGNIVNYVGLLRDVTHELQLEEQYRQAQKMEAVGQLTAGIAHDFNNLLTAVNGFAELALLRLAPDDPTRELVDKVLDSGQRAADLVSQLMAFSRKQVLEPQLLDLNAVVAEMDKLLRRTIGEHIELKTSLAPDLWPVEVDPTQMEQVVVNLAVNARDAMPDGGHLTVETANVELGEDYVAGHLGGKPGNYVLLAISDTGVGMSEEVQTRIFEPFFTTKEHGKGTGLGLSTVFGIVKQSGGDIHVYSEEGVGTTFKVYLPRAGEAVALPIPPEVTEGPPSGDETILVVEDHAEVRALAWGVLQEQGYTVLEAENGQQALQVAARHPGPIHLLLTDVTMPKMSGKVLAGRLAQIRPDLKILFMSGYTDNAIAHQGRLDPGVAFLQKPFSPVALARKVRAVLDG
jgi:PAS domain S-box-containing protein